MILFASVHLFQEEFGLVGQGVLELEAYILPCSALLERLEQLLLFLAISHSQYLLHLVHRMPFERGSFRQLESPPG